MGIADPAGQWVEGEVQPCLATVSAPVPWGQAKPAQAKRGKRTARETDALSLSASHLCVCLSLPLSLSLSLSHCVAVRCSPPPPNLPVPVLQINQAAMCT
jgi:hypothetical protein